jgi:hypothetical protein
MLPGLVILKILTLFTSQNSAPSFPTDLDTEVTPYSAKSALRYGLHLLLPVMRDGWPNICLYLEWKSQTAPRHM